MGTTGAYLHALGPRLQRGGGCIGWLRLARYAREDARARDLPPRDKEWNEYSIAIYIL